MQVSYCNLLENVILYITTSAARALCTGGGYLRFRCAASIFLYCNTAVVTAGEGMFFMFDEKLTAHLAELSKLEFTDEELADMTKDMTDIIGLMDKVCGFNDGVNPYTLDPVDYADLRSDEHADSYPSNEILENAKNIKNDSFVVPKVV